MTDSETYINWESIDRIVVGLGNPGDEYTGTRHNLGFRALDAFLKLLEIKKHFEPVRKSRVQKVMVAELNVLLVRPTTYMNLSGSAVKPLLERTDLDLSNLLIVHDEMDLPAGVAKMRVGGGAAGHKGVGDIIDRCGEDFARLKIGIGNPSIQSADDSSSGIDWVLGEIGPDEKAVYIDLMPKVAECIRMWIVDGPDKTMTWFNAEMKTSTSEEPADEEIGDSAVKKAGGLDE